MQKKNNNNDSIREYSKVNGRPQIRDPKISESTKLGKCQRKGFLGDLREQKTIGKSWESPYYKSTISIEENT